MTSDDELMMHPPSSTSARTRVSVRSVALPAQHGGWGFWLEPTLLGALVAPSASGLLLSGAALLVFLFHHPFTIAFKDWRRGRRYERTRIAARFALIFGGGALLLASAAVLIALRQTGEARFLLPLILSAPLALIQIVMEARGQGRSLIAEASGAALFAGLAPASAIYAGWTGEAAFGLWAILIARVLPSIVYVRARLRLEKGRPTAAAPAVALHAAALAALGALALAGLIPFTPLLGELVLLVRAVLGTSIWRRPTAPRIIGFQEIGYGVLVIGVAAFGYWLA